MTPSSADHQEQSKREPELPFAAPCRNLTASASLRWLARGWADLRRAPRQSLSYGVAMTIVSGAVSASALYFANIYTFLALLSGFIFLGPMLAIGLYSISRQLQQNRTPRIGYCLREGRRNLGNALVFGIILLIVFLIWARAASMVHVFFPVRANPSWADLSVFLAVGSAIGSVFAAMIFAASAFSLPMIMDRQVDTVTAVITSINAVLRNRAAMAAWAGLIVLAVALAFATAFLGFVVVMPLLGHATWHGYQETIDASAWPVNAPAPT